MGKRRRKNGSKRRRLDRMMVLSPSSVEAYAGGRTKDSPMFTLIKPDYELKHELFPPCGWDTLLRF